MARTQTPTEITTAALRHRLEALLDQAGYEEIDTLLTRNSDGFDFHDISAAGLRHLMELAFQAGLNAANTEGITTLTKVDEEEFTEADHQPLHVAPETLQDEDEARWVGTHGDTNTWMPVGAGRYILVYTTWINATGWVKIPAVYTATGGTFERTAWNPAGFDNNNLREEAGAEAQAWALAH